MCWSDCMTCCRLEADLAMLIAMLALDVNSNITSTACICDEPAALLIFAQQMLGSSAPPLALRLSN